MVLFLMTYSTMACHACAHNRLTSIMIHAVPDEKVLENEKVGTKNVKEQDGISTIIVNHSYK